MKEIQCGSEMKAVCGVLADGERQAAVTVTGCSTHFPPILVQTDDGRKCLGLLLGWPSRSVVRLIVKHTLLGRKARVAVLRPDGSERAVWIVRVLWTQQLIDGSYENGAMFLEPDPCMSGLELSNRARAVRSPQQGLDTRAGGGVRRRRGAG